MYLVLVARLGNVCHPGVTSFEGVNGREWRETEAWRCKRLGEAIDEGATSVAVEGLGLMGSCKGVEAWHEESLGEAIGESAAQLQQVHR